jgi:lysophospholipase L1-like esterase
VALVAVSAAAAADRPAPKSYYLALGDSLAYGVQPDKVARGLPPAAYDTGFVDLFAARLRARNAKLEVVNYACPGESTVTFVLGGCPWLAEGRKLHRPFRGAQAQAALAFLAAHPGQVSPITVTLFGNDIVPEFGNCRNLVACARARGPKVIAAFAARLGSILGRLRASAPGAEMIVTGAWNFDEEHPALTAALFRPLNQAMAREASRVKARFADPLPFFNIERSPAVQRARLCVYTYVCSRADPHPTDAGYRAYARAVIEASSYTG